MRSLPARLVAQNIAARAADTSTQGHEVGHNKGQATRDNDGSDPASEGFITA